MDEGMEERLLSDLPGSFCGRNNQGFPGIPTQCRTLQF